MPIQKRRRRPSVEGQIQRAVFQNIWGRGVPNLFAFHVPNGANFGGDRALAAMQMANLKKKGFVPGVPDIFLVHDGKTYTIELKAPGGSVSEKQMEVRAKLDDAGAFTAVCDSLDAALRCLEAWKLLKGQAA
jgi:hypothetical protein